jgi:antimicrobial peptide system SdpB family protein
MNWFLYCHQISKTNYFTNVYGLARSFFALSVLIPLIFDSKYVLFPEHLLELNSSNSGLFFNAVNVFFIFDYEDLIIPRLISITVLCLVISGFRPRITGVLQWWITFSFFKATGLPEGGDQINSILSLLLIPITMMDSRKNHWLPPTDSNQYKNFTAFLIYFVIQVQMSVIYLHAATEKIYKLDLWLDGTAIYYWLNDSVFGMSDWLSTLVNPILNFPFLLSLFTWSVFIFELVLSGGIFMSKRNKLILLKFGIVFHFLIIVFHGLVSFFFVMTGGLILYLVPKERNLIFPLGFIRTLKVKLNPNVG